MYSAQEDPLHILNEAWAIPLAINDIISFCPVFACPSYQESSHIRSVSAITNPTANAKDGATVKKKKMVSLQW